MPNLKTLAVKLKNMSRAGEVKRFMQLLELFPNLETLYIQVINFIYSVHDFFYFIFLQKALMNDFICCLLFLFRDTVV